MGQTRRLMSDAPTDMAATTGASPATGATGATRAATGATPATDATGAAGAADPVDGPDAAEGSAGRTGIGRFGSAGLALAGGLLVAFSLPPWGWWPLALVGLVLFDRAVADAPPWTRFRRAWLTGVGVLAPSTVWMAAFTPPGYVIQVVCFSAILGGLVAASPAGPWRWAALPGAWAAFEAIKGRWPFGGVPLSELAMGQVAGPLGGIARVAGVIGIAIVTVTVAMALSAAWSRAWRPALGLAAAALAALGFAAVAPAGEPTGETLTVAYIQGGGEQGTRDADTDDREVFLAHHDATVDSIERDEVDLIVWPENVVNVDGPIAEQTEGEELADLAVALDTPILAGIVEGVDTDSFTNATVLFDTDGSITARYDKVRRVPFGEFVPFRGLLEPIAGDVLPAKDAVPGEDPSTLTVTVDGREVRVGVMISWEVFFGDRGRDAVLGRGDEAALLLNPTNGSSYTGTVVQSQQIASSRLRAIETGRWVTQVAPTGFSAFVTDQGTVLDRSGVSEQRVEVRDVGLREGATLFTRFGAWPPFLLAVALIVGSRVVPAALGRKVG